MSESLSAPVKIRVNPPSGLQKAYVCSIVMIGTVEETFENHKKMVQKIRLSWELSETNHTFKEEEGPKPFIVHKEFTFAMGSKANLRKMLNVFGKDGGSLTEEQAKNFNIAALLETAMYVNIVIETSKKGDKYANIASLAVLPDAESISPMRSKPLLFASFEKFDTEAFERIDEWTQNKIKTSVEYKALVGAAPVAVAAAPVAEAQPAVRKKTPF